VSTASGALEALGGITALVGADRFNADGELTLRAGKKRYCLVRVR
jgi:hypothetical protein